MDVDLNPDVYYTFGRAYATWLSIHRIVDCAVGHDNRITSKDYKKAFIQGLNDGGIETYDMGYALSQMVYYAAYEYKTKGYAMITASHNPRQYNGLKLGTGYSETMLSEEVIAFRELCNKADFVTATTPAANHKVNIFDSYLRTILKNFSLRKKNGKWSLMPVTPLVACSIPRFCMRLVAVSLSKIASPMAISLWAYLIPPRSRSSIACVRVSSNMRLIWVWLMTLMVTVWPWSMKLGEFYGWIVLSLFLLMMSLTP